jgi:hypothetical protein
VGSCEHGNEHLDSIEGGEFLKLLNKKLCSMQLVS